MKIVYKIRKFRQRLTFKKICKAAIRCGCDLDGDTIFYNGQLYFINVYEKRYWKVDVSKRVKLGPDEKRYIRSDIKGVKKLMKGLR